MHSVKTIYRIGPGPSASHTIAPMNAAKDFISNELDKDSFIEVTLFGSLALTGKGHHTDKIISDVLSNFKHEIKFDFKSDIPHINTMTFRALKDSKEVLKRTYYSLGGGELYCEEDKGVLETNVYPFKSFNEIKEFMLINHMERLHEVVEYFEGKDSREYFKTVALTMFDSVKRGINATGTLRASKTLVINKNAKDIHSEAKKIKNKKEKEIMLVTSYAYAVSEENASGNVVVSAPTCGSSGVVPSILYYYYHDAHVSMERIIDALMAAGLVANVFRTNATISGAVGGCQAEIGVAVCMGTTIQGDIEGLSLEQIEYGCELDMEHQLGLTCDPLDGYVVIPCIERNAVGAVRSYEGFLFAKHIQPTRNANISLDDIVSAMKLTGQALPQEYKETSKGCLSDIANKEHK